MGNICGHGQSNPREEAFQKKKLKMQSAIRYEKSPAREKSEGGNSEYSMDAPKIISPRAKMDFTLPLGEITQSKVKEPEIYEPSHVSDTIQSFRNFIVPENLPFRGVVKIKVTQAKLNKTKVEISDENSIGFEIITKDTNFIPQTKGYVLDQSEIKDLEEKSLLEKDDQIIFTKDPTSPLEEEEEEDYTPRNFDEGPIAFDLSTSKQSRNKFKYPKHSVQSNKLLNDSFSSPAFQTISKINFGPVLHVLFRDEIAQNLSRFQNYSENVPEFEENLEIEIRDENLDQQIMIKFSCQKEEPFGLAKVNFSDLKFLRSQNQQRRESKGVFISDKWDSAWYNVYKEKKDNQQLRLAGIGNHVVTDEIVGKVKIESIFQVREINDLEEQFQEFLQKDTLEDINQMEFEEEDNEEMNIQLGMIGVGNTDILDLSGNSHDLGGEHENQNLGSYGPKFDAMSDEELDAEIQRAIEKKQKEQQLQISTIREEDDLESSEISGPNVPESESEREAAEDGPEEEEGPFQVNVYENAQFQVNTEEDAPFEIINVIPEFESPEPVNIKKLTKKKTGGKKKKKKTVSLGPKKTSGSLAPTKQLSQKVIKLTTKPIFEPKKQIKSKQRNIQSMTRNKPLERLSLPQKKPISPYCPSPEKKPSLPKFKKKNSIKSENVDLKDDIVNKINNLNAVLLPKIQITDVKNSLGFQDYPDILDQKGHLMKFAFSSVAQRDLSCNLCLEDIDAVLGYFECKLCLDTYCRECAVDRDKNETEMAENPYLIATPMQDVLRTSMTRSLNASTFRMPIDNTKMLQQELQNLNMNLTEFEQFRDVLFDDPEIKFAPRLGNKLDSKISNILRIMKSDVPVVHLKDNLYLVGLYKFNLTLKGDYVQIQIGPAHYQRLADYLKENKEFVKNKYTIISLKNENDPVLEIVNKLILKEPIIGFDQSIISQDQTFVSRFNQSNSSNRTSVRGFGSPDIKLSFRRSMGGGVGGFGSLLNSPGRSPGRKLVIPATVAQQTRISNFQEEKEKLREKYRARKQK